MFKKYNGIIWPVALSFGVRYCPNTSRHRLIASQQQNKWSSGPPSTLRQGILQATGRCARPAEEQSSTGIGFAIYAHIFYVHLFYALDSS
ncbi:hypothetical protein EOD39_10152 [Acipenser ruthenus]|uniref:Uncharacterized protein n=1 Tax=Acipenser ruthenus TaxID=7906 RepID=A0A662YVN9_ACIRT|nr:hypothetical protein EOD39_10152 [Acipenser ruthenus]